MALRAAESSPANDGKPPGRAGFDGRAVGIGETAGMLGALGADTTGGAGTSIAFAGETAANARAIVEAAVTAKELNRDSKISPKKEPGAPYPKALLLCQM